MASDTASSVDEQQPQLVTSTTDNRGRHWILAELNRLEQELKFLQIVVLLLLDKNLGQLGLYTAQWPSRSHIQNYVHEELAELENTENVSTICSELLPYIEGRPDPLLPVTNGPINLIWDRWFEGPQNAQTCSCLIL